MSTTSVSTSLPTGLSSRLVVAALHNHDLMIRTLCPALVSYNFESGNPNTQATYTVTDRKPNGLTTYKLTLTNNPTGVDSLVNANPPVGILTIAGKWRVGGGKLVEDVMIDGNFMMKKMAKGNVEKTHPGHHAMLFQLAARA
ncbi:hypothetical protein BU24DRAFT_494294 [Aaosphaeria arxii CBS 175.79]|uniref:DUF7053 domain-containing protein n=1 Tax=Aaosphaeria arxii CBS 175.79 TaxID=1450172 RepID=A0A6A5XKU5_9PLEO|nr:uncharacterized protein BU24DRAFT_494294 [Aaosphaeria arxii CBS 175.79]KAF2013918.1 hypothetical protein BU24DRAFT_494294 [Aaosphaeria arxii CBS 175.79]